MVTHSHSQVVSAMPAFNVPATPLRKIRFDFWILGCLAFIGLIGSCYMVFLCDKSDKAPAISYLNQSIGAPTNNPVTPLSYKGRCIKHGQLTFSLDGLPSDDLVIDYGNGHCDALLEKPVKHSYAKSGTYNVQVIDNNDWSRILASTTVRIKDQL